MVDSTAKKIEAAVVSEPEGKIIFSSDYAEMGTPEAIKKSLIRLCERNVIVRLAHGIYYKPKFDKELGLGMLLPSLDDIAQAIAKRDHSRIVPTGDYALNSLGLSTQVPANAVYLTDGSPRKITIGKGHGIVFKHTSELKVLSFRSDLMMRIVAAMRAIGEGKITNEQKHVLKEYINNVSDEDYNEDIKLAPLWVRKELITL
ncbi:MAG: hypothetical protein IJ633_08340 [Prevotella sp.]|nr:hypothetical protein [Prevotella sp.]